ncbi:MAG TPA: SAF domain-containing protein [Acidimicrobiales bacterium]|nr:SAF domain-containing protein [Acidimicrobiales bacterium]
MSAPSLPRPPLRGPTRALRLPRRPIPFWLAAVALALVTGLAVARLVGQASAEAARWGDVRPTAVATVDLEAGATVGPGDVEIEHRPAALVPDGALDGGAEGRVVTATVHRGEPVLAARLAPAGLSPTAAVLPAGTVGIAVPAGPGALPLQTGDVVEALVTVDPTAAGGGEPTFAVARSALVVHVGDEAVTLAVDRGDADRLAFALTAGVVTLVLSPGSR